MNPTQAKYPHIRRKGGYKDPSYRKSAANSERIRAVMRTHGVTQARAAKLLKIQVATLQRWFYVDGAPEWAAERMERAKRFPRG